jgi:NAD(P)H-quinone oxidoreductase subunit 4
MQMYDVKTVAVNAQLRQSLMTISQTNPHVYARELLVPIMPGLNTWDDLAIVTPTVKAVL